MIDINLVPQNSQKKRRRTPAASGSSIPKEAIVGLCGGLIVLLVIVHVVLQGVIFSQFKKHKELSAQWTAILPQKQKVDVVMNELRALQGRIKSTQEVLGKQRILWSQKLNLISDSLPSGVWLTNVSFDGEILFIKGSSVSKGIDEMISIHRFASNLEGHEAFLKDLKDFELGSIQRRSISDIEIADFSIKAKTDELE